MNINISIYNTIKWIAWMALISLLFVLTISAVRKQSKEKVRAIAIELVGEGLLTKSDVIELFKRKFGNKFSQKQISDTDLRYIESILDDDIYINNSNAYLDRNNKLHLVIRECTPLFRLLSRDGKDQYVDIDKQFLPIQEGRNLRLPVITVDKGFTKKLPLEELVSFVSKVSRDHFMSALVEQIHIQTDNKVWVVPKIGKEKILLGSLSNIDNKIQKIKTFYKKGLTAKGWNTYKEINVSYTNQVVCTNK